MCEKTKKKINPDLKQPRVKKEQLNRLGYNDTDIDYLILSQLIAKKYP